jgi:CheY-like chemotaxis protein
MQRILVVDADQAFRYALASFLSTAGFDVAEAGDYLKALDVLEDNRPLHLLVVGVQLPTVNGLAIARMARMKRLSLPIIHITTFEIPGDEAIGPVFTKPVDFYVLLDEAQRMLEADDAATDCLTERR